MYCHHVSGMICKYMRAAQAANSNTEAADGGRCFMVSTYAVVEQRRRLVLHSCGGRVPHRRARVAKPGVLESTTVSTQQLFAHPEPGCHVRLCSAG